MAIYKRGKTYWFEFTFEGRRVRESAKTGNRRAAEQIESARKVQLAKREVGLDVERIVVPTLRDAIRTFLHWSQTEHAAKMATSRRYETSSKPLLHYFRDKTLDDISPDDVEKYKQWRSRQTKKPPHKKLKTNSNLATKKTIKPATVNRELACLKIVFNHFIKCDTVTKNPVSKVKFLQENNNIFVVLTPDEERRYLMEASQPLQDVAVLMLESGCRPDEIYNLRKVDVDLVEDNIQIQCGKTTAARRRIPLTGRARTILERRLSSIEGVYVFGGGRKGTDRSKPIIKLNNAHTATVIRSKTRKFRLYDLRHTFASRMAMAGVDLVTLAALIGHSRVQMVMRYAHPIEEHKIDAMQKLETYNRTKAKAA